MPWGYGGPMIPLTSLLVILFLLLLVHRVTSTLLELTGLSRDTARLQSLSALTGTGFTTAESEFIVTHPLRRRITMFLMLVGNTGIVTVAASVVVGWMEIRDHPKIAPILVMAFTGAILLLALAQSRLFNRSLERLVVHLAERSPKLSVLDYAGLLQVGRGYIVGKHNLRGDEWFCGLRLAESRLRNAGVVVLGVSKPGGEFIGAPHGETRLEPNDLISMYGRASRIEKVIAPVRPGETMVDTRRPRPPHGQDFQGVEACAMTDSLAGKWE